MNEEVEVAVRRSTKFPDRFRAYKVKVDGAVRGSMGAGKSLTFRVPPGKHVLSVRIDWCGSDEIAFNATRGQMLAFECGSSLGGWRVFLAPVYILFRRNKYLWIRPVK